MKPEPLAIDKSGYSDLIRQISLADSPVGIDAQYTHAIIITYLQRITERLQRIETMMGAQQG